MTPRKTSKTVQARGRGILCATDFSHESGRAAEAAAAMARKLEEPLTLAHAIEVPHLGDSREKFIKLMTESRRGDQRKQAEKLRRGGAEVKVSTTQGRTDEVICDLARTGNPRMIVMASHRRRGAVDRWLLGSAIERTAERAAAPTLVVRDAAPLQAWARGERRLKIFVCFNFTMTAQAALRWVKELRNIGPCEVVVGHVDWPAEQFVRLGGEGPLPFDGNPPEIQAVLERDVRMRTAEALGRMPFRVRVEANWGRTDVRLAAIAKEEAADLLVVGSHQYQRVERLWRSSVSRGLLHEAPMNVAIVPLAADQALGPAMPPPVRRVLVSTDFSDLANEAIPKAYSILHGGGTVHLVHVMTPPPSVRDDDFTRAPRRAGPASAKHAEECMAKLRALIPADAAVQGIYTHAEVVKSRNVAEAICQAAERLNADVLCLGTHGRSGLSKAVLGSVAEGVLTRSRRPLLIVRPQPK